MNKAINLSSCYILDEESFNFEDELLEERSWRKAFKELLGLMARFSWFWSASGDRLHYSFKGSTLPLSESYNEHVPPRKRYSFFYIHFMENVGNMSIYYFLSSLTMSMPLINWTFGLEANSNINGKRKKG
ncbi:hypothetical protein YC2023_037318 [Brassica napus]